MKTFLCSLWSMLLLLCFTRSALHGQCNSTTVTFSNSINGDSKVFKNQFTSGNARSFYSGCVSGTYDDSDKVYQINIPAAGWLQVSIQELLGGNGDYYDIFLVDKVGTCTNATCLKYEDSNLSNFFIDYSLAAGTYYLFVEDASGSSGSSGNPGFDIDLSYEKSVFVSCADQNSIACGSTISGTTVGSSLFKSSIYYDVNGTMVGNANAGPSLYYPFFPTQSGSYTITLTPTNNKDLELYLQNSAMNACPSRYNCKAFSNNGSSGQVEQITVFLNAGEKFHVTVDGWMGDAGTFTLSVAGPCGGGGGCNFSTTNLDFASLPYSITNQAIGTTNNYSMHSKAGCDFPSTGFDKIYKIVVPASNIDNTKGVEVSLKNSNNTGSPRMFVYAESCTGDFFAVSNPPKVPNPNGSPANSQQGIIFENGFTETTYYIVVESNGSSTFDLRVDQNNGAFVTCDYPVITCGGSINSSIAGNGGRDVFVKLYPAISFCPNLSKPNFFPFNSSAEKVFKITPTVSGSYTFNLTNLSSDLELFLIEGGCILNEIDSWSVNSGNASESITYDLIANQPYVIVVDGFNGAQGSFTLSVTGPCNSGSFCCPFVPTLSGESADRNMPIGCSLLDYSYVGPGSRFKFQAIGLPAGSTIIQWCYRNVNNPADTVRFVNSSTSNTYTFPAGYGSTYEVCVKYKLANGQEFCCCKVICIDDPFACDRSWLRPIPTAQNYYVFDLINEPNAQDIRWKVDTHPNIPWGTSSSFTVPLQEDYTVTVSWYDGTCYKMCCKRVCWVNPVTCGLAKPRPIPTSNNLYTLEVGENNITDVRWEVDGNPSFNSTNLTYAPPFTGSGTYTIYVRYKTQSGCYKVCCVKVCYAPPVNCNSLRVRPVPTSNGFYELESSDSGISDMKWEVGSNPNLTSTNLIYAPPFPVDGSYFVYARYKLPSGCYVVCCIKVCYANPFNCNNLKLRPIPLNDKYVFDLNEPSASDITWKVHETNETVNSGLSFVPNSLQVGQMYNISVKYKVGDCYKVCCIKVCYDLPSTCGSAKPRPIPTSNNLYTLEITDSNISDVQWEVEGNPSFTSTSSTYAPPFSGSGTYTTYVRYKTQSGCYKICCVKVCYAPPVNCNSLRVRPVPTSSGFYELESIDGGITDVKWEVGSNPNLTSTNTTYAPPFPSDGSYFVYARYKLPSGCYIVCCIKVCYTNPFNCNNLRLKPIPLNDKYVFELNEPGASDLTWKVHETNETVNSGLTFVPTSLQIGQMYNVSVKYKIGDCYKVCCIKICYQLASGCNVLRPYPFATSGGFEYQFGLDEPNSTVESWQTSNGAPNYNSIMRPPNPPSDQDYTIYCVYKTVDNCYKICCSKVCYSNPVLCGVPTLSYNYAGTALTYQFSSNSSFQNIKWYRSSASGYQEIPDQYDFTSNGSGEYTICFRYYDPSVGCWRICCKKVCISNPFDCGSIGIPRPLFANNESKYEFVLTDSQIDQSSIQWQVDEYPTQDNLNGQSTFVPKTNLMTSGQNYTITVKYRTLPDGCYKVCCKRICYEPFSNCSAVINLSSSGSLINASISSAFTDVFWYALLPNASNYTLVGNGNALNNYTVSSSGNTLITCVYRIPGSNCYKICNRPVNPCVLPVANFTYVQNNATLSFTNTSTGSGNSYAWTFGNGQTASSTNPSVTYTQSGSYEVCLTVNNACGTNKKCFTVNVVLPQDLITADVDDNQCGALNSIISIPVRVKNFNAISGFELDHLLTNNDFGEFVDVQSTLLPNLFYSVKNKNLKVVWDEPTGQLKSYADNTIIYTIRIQVNGLNGVKSSDIVFGPADKQVFTRDNLVLVGKVIKGSVCIADKIDLGGKITKPNGQGVSNVKLFLSGDVTKSTVTDQEGNYKFDQLTAGGNYVIKPQKDTNYLNGVKVNDITAIRNDILNNEKMGAYKLIAGDVTNDKKVNVADITTIRNLILNNITDFPAVESWRFVTKSHVFTDTLNPWNSVFPEDIQINVANTSLSNLDFVGLKMGDVTQDNNPKAIAADAVDRNAAKIDFYFEPVYNSTDNSYQLNIRTNDFNQVTGMQFSINWDSTRLSYQGINSTNSFLGLDTLVHFDRKKVKSGLLGLIWDDPTAAGKTLANKTAIFSVKLKVLGNKGDLVKFNFGKIPIDIFIDSKTGELQFNGINGEIRVSNEELQSNQNVRILPNPASGHFQIQGLLETITEVNILDMQGKWVAKAEDQNNRYSIADLPSGLYLVKITTKSGAQYYCKLIKVD